jgi:peroxiredoxin (alkyl hydroperoxide reductase subunit C)
MSPVIQSPAPAFTVTAHVDGEFKQVTLSDYIGQWYSIYYPFLLWVRHSDAFEI